MVIVTMPETISVNAEYTAVEEEEAQLHASKSRN